MKSPRVFLIPALLALSACRGAESRPPEKAAARPAPAALPADVQEVADSVNKPEAASADTATEANGGLRLSGEFVSPMQSEVVSKVIGRVGQVHVDEGARINKGQPLLTVETEYLELEAKQAEAEKARAKAAYSEAKRELERKQTLLAKGSVPQALFDRTQSAYEQAEAALAAADSHAALARQKRNDAVLLSPVTGVVIKRNADVGERLNDATVAFVVAQTAPLRLRFRVPERYLAAVHDGQRVRAGADAYPQEVFEGQVTLVGQSVDPATRTFLVEAEFANKDGRLKPGLFARVELADVR